MATFGPSNYLRGYSGFQVTGMIEWGQKSNPSFKNFQKALNDVSQIIIIKK